MERAMSDPVARPISKEERARMKRRPRAFINRRAFRIPIGTLRDWEQGRTEPDQANQAYLKVIAMAPFTVQKALALKPGEPAIERFAFKD